MNENWNEKNIKLNINLKRREGVGDEDSSFVI